MYLFSGSPLVVYMADKKAWRLYYVGSKSSVDRINLDLGLSTSLLDLDNGIGVAESTDETGTCFKRL